MSDRGEWWERKGVARLDRMSEKLDKFEKEYGEYSWTIAKRVVRLEVMTLVGMAALTALVILT